MEIAGIEVLYRDERIIACDKPSGLLSVPGIGPDKQDCLVSRLNAALHGETARILHRLDRDTSGVILLALDAEAHRELSRQFHDRETEKVYIALVAGHVAEEQGEIDLPIRKDMDPARKPRQLVDHQHGRRAITRWRVLESTDSPLPSGEGSGVRAERLRGHEPAFPVTRLELRPITGRSHQIRLHLKEIGHPILGDDLYAPPEVVAVADRLMLHASLLTVVHPTTAALMTFDAECPF